RVVEACHCSHYFAGCSGDHRDGIGGAIHYISLAPVWGEGGAEWTRSNRDGRCHGIAGDGNHRDVVASRVLDVRQTAVRSHRYPTRSGTYGDGVNHGGAASHLDHGNGVGRGIGDVGERPLRRKRHRHPNRIALHRHRGHHGLRSRVDHRNTVGRSVHHIGRSSVRSESHAKGGRLNRNCGHYAAARGVDHRHVVPVIVANVNLFSAGRDSNSPRSRTHEYIVCHLPDWNVNHRDGITVNVGYIGKRTSLGNGECLRRGG